MNTEGWTHRDFSKKSFLSSLLHRNEQSLATLAHLGGGGWGPLSWPREVTLTCLEAGPAYCGPTLLRQWSTLYIWSGNVKAESFMVWLLCPKGPIEEPLLGQHWNAMNFSALNCYLAFDLIFYYKYSTINTRINRDITTLKIETEVVNKISTVSTNIPVFLNCDSSLLLQ